MLVLPVRHSNTWTVAIESCLFALALALPSRNGGCQDFSLVPGIVVDYEPSPTPQQKNTRKGEVYIGSPSITVMPNGTYIASHDLFGSGTKNDTTKVFRSTDKGGTWNRIAILTGQFWSTVFQHHGSLYLLGYSGGSPSGNIVIRRSIDGGATWTMPDSPTTGLLRRGQYGSTPNAPVIYGGRIWIGQGGAQVMSATVESDLLKGSSWTLSNTIPNSSRQDFFGSQWSGWYEGQVVGSPQFGVMLLPRIQGLPYTARIQVDRHTGELNFDGFVPLPGGEKKFGAAYDVISKKFYVLSNPVLPGDADHALVGKKPELIRNTAAVLSSNDLRNWNVEKIFLYTPNIDNGDFGEAFQYFNFAVDGNDLAIVSRTAFNVGEGQNKPPRGHDSNLMTFHRIDNFRNRSPEHLLTADTERNQVLRYEVTQHANAPLGKFTLGTTFDGAKLTRPVGIAQASSGDTYIKEEAGRILHFDAAGNFIGGASSAPGMTFTPQLAIRQPAAGQRSWISSESGNWADPTNWYYWGRPDTSDEVALFGSAIDRNQTVTVNDSFTVKGLIFRSGNAYALEGKGEINIKSSAGEGVIDVDRGNHQIKAVTKLRSDTTASAHDSAELHFHKKLDLNCKVLRLTGNGRIFAHDQFVMSGGKLVVNGQAVLTFDRSTNAKLNGAIQLVLDESIVPRPGLEFHLLNGIELVNDTFQEVTLPELSGGLYWDTSYLYLNGTVSVAGPMSVLALDSVRSPATDPGKEIEPDASIVPGVVITHSPANSGVYFGSPGIAVLENGVYLAKCDEFGPNTSEHERAVSHVFQSTDRGKTWRHLAKIDGLFWASIFVHRGAVYLFGTNRHHGDTVILRSQDGGKNWSKPSSLSTGLLLRGEYHTAPVPVVVHKGRIWRAMEDAKGGTVWGQRYRAFMMSAPEDANLLEAANWRCSSVLTRNPEWLNGKCNAWLEGNAVVTPRGNIVNILRVDYSPDGGIAATIHYSDDGREAKFDPAADFIQFPGGATKFTIRHDPVTNLYSALANYVPSFHRGGQASKTRNTLALVNSADLRNWTVKCIVLYHPDIEKHGFQYVDWLIDGDDLIVAARTAYDDGLGGAHNQHDANFLTFHRVKNFRHLQMVDSKPLFLQQGRAAD